MLTAIFLGWCAGIALQLQQVVLWQAFIYMACAAVSAVCLVFMAFARHRLGKSFWIRLSSMVLGFVLSAMLSFGVTGWRACEREAQRLAPALEGLDIDVVGVVSAMPQPLEMGWRFQMAVESAYVRGDDDKSTDQGAKKGESRRTLQAVQLPPKLLLSLYSRQSLAWRNEAHKTHEVYEAHETQEVNEAQETELAAPWLIETGRLSLAPGQRWQMTVRLKAPHGAMNPHGFDHELWLWEQGIGATGYVRLGKQQKPPLLLGMADGFWAYGMERWRSAVRDRVLARLDGKDITHDLTHGLSSALQSASGVVAALVAGDQRAIERAHWDVFRATGVAHLVSISGLHITMFAWLAALLVGRLWRLSVRLTPRLCLWLPAAHAGWLGGLLLAALYAWFSGWGVPAQRTIWMLAMFVTLRVVGLKMPWHITWLLAACLILAIDPWAFYQAGFWLSFVAVAILFSLDIGAPAHKVWALLREQWLMTIGLAPLSLLFFQQISIVGLAANLLAIPFITLLVTPLSLLGVAIPFLWETAALAMSALMAVLSNMAQWPYAVYSAPNPPFELSALAVLATAIWVVPRAVLWRALPLVWQQMLQARLGLEAHSNDPSNAHSSGAKRRGVIFGWLFKMVITSVLVLPALLWKPSAPAHGQFDVRAIDIGQGTAILVRTATHHLLFDAGPRFSMESDAGHRTIVPLLRSLGVRLDVLMLSHRDSDHTGGARSVLAAHPQAQVMLGGAHQPNSLADQRFLGLVPSRIKPCFAGQTWHWDGVRFEVLHPTLPPEGAATAATARLTSNSLSCVLKITAQSMTSIAPDLSFDLSSEPSPDLYLGAPSALLTGDIEAQQEADLLRGQAHRLASTLFFVPHHGSKTSSSPAFLKAVAPRFAVIQAGYRNRFGHPHPSVMARLDALGIPTIATPACGAAYWQSKSADTIACQRRAQPRYWHHRIEP